ncbi:MAG: 30S ribosomal protein THX [Candidatus Arcticimaribacter sp.]|nr:30S ribosomal protein THX [Flavobacteriaceae bacterium]MDB9911009.1 30S ribosomal protein THX [Flavobacteriaceae bacterium]PSR10519.1 MAG: 30S ribosomal protein THX [Candidatus Arcticimaribacter sp.]PTM00236.1 MAG: 30S ribosomal protein THX [Candidatus Arcticimaribacter sp.]|tara:strand:- start:45 stop:149 length:105 start_codon:yes stop_codon:yes gene_type:complete
MGKGDKKSRRGKIILGTSGVKRNRKKNKKKRARS